jgi:hypothetical protein
MDFGFANPFVCLWIEQREDGTTLVFDEYLQSMRTTEEHIGQIESREWPKVRHVCCDPAGAGRNDQTAASNIQLLRACGYVVRSRKSGILEGLELIRAALRPAAGKPRLFIHPRCKKADQGDAELPLPTQWRRAAGQGWRIRSPDRCAALLLRQHPTRPAVEARTY